MNVKNVHGNENNFIAKPPASFHVSTSFEGFNELHKSQDTSKKGFPLFEP